MNSFDLDSPLPNNLWTYVRGREDLDSIFSRDIEFSGFSSPLDLDSLRGLVKNCLQNHFVDPGHSVKAQSLKALLHKVDDDTEMGEVAFHHRQAFYTWKAEGQLMDAIHLAMMHHDIKGLSNVTSAELAKHFKPGVFNALHMAALEGQEDHLRVLLRHAPSLDTANQKGETPLHLAALSGSAECVRLLIAHGADVMAGDAAGTTALMIAAEDADETLVNLLLPHSNPSATNRRGQTASDLARDDSPEIAEVIDGLSRALKEKAELEQLPKSTKAPVQRTM